MGVFWITLISWRALYSSLVRKSGVKPLPGSPHSGSCPFLRASSSWIYISDVPFSEFGLPEYSTVTQKGFESDILIKFAGAGLFVGGAILAAVKLYAERREAIMKSEGEGGN